MDSEDKVDANGGKGDDEHAAVEQKESLELEEKKKDEDQEKLLHDGEKEEHAESRLPSEEDNSPMSKAFFFSKYVTFW